MKTPLLYHLLKVMSDGQSRTAGKIHEDYPLDLLYGESKPMLQELVNKARQDGFLLRNDDRTYTITADGRAKMESLERDS